jgi:predicted Rossmann fold nucleotide-binding protein DprA/Smf involved in DNA uptake
MYRQDRIADVLKASPKTIPELARELGCPANEVTDWVMAMRRYGKVAELPKARADDYYQYQLVEDK